MSRRPVLTFALCAIAFAPGLSADWPQLVGRWPYGPTYAVAVSGNYAYFGSGAAMMIADVSLPSAPQVVGEVALQGVAKGITAVGNYAYLAADDAGLLVIDVGAPSAPVEVGSVDPGGNASAVAVSNGYAYVVDGETWDSPLRVIDISTPSAPMEAGFLATPTKDFDVAVAGGYAFVASHEGGLRVIDVSAPSMPVEVAFLGMPGVAVGIAVSGTYAYVAAADAGLRIVDVSIPSAPVEVGIAPSYAFDVAVLGGYAYVVGGDGLRVIDVSTPSAPVELGWVATPSRSADEVAVSGDHAYVADSIEGLRVIEVSSPSAPVAVGFADVPGCGAYELAVAGDYAYAAFFGWNSGLQVVDASNPTAPVRVGLVHTPSAGDIAVEDGYAYLAVLDSGIRVIDLRTPSAPVVVGAHDTPGWASGAAVADGYAYVADWYVLRVIDVRTPSAPVEVAHLDTPDGLTGISVSGGYAYVADRGSILRVIDIGTPSAPVEIGSVDTRGAGWNPEVSGRYACVVGGDSRLWLINVSTPSAPIEAGVVSVPSTEAQGAGGVAVSGRYVYVADGYGDLRLIDVSTPSAPVEVGFIDTPGVAWDVAITNGYVFVALGDAGLAVFRDWAASYIPAAAVAAGAQGAFFQTDLEINNTGTEEAHAYLQWLPRGENNSNPVNSDLFSLQPGQSLRWENVLTELFGLGPDSVGALKLVASTDSVIGMSRTYNIPAGKAAGTFGQGLPAIRVADMIAGTQPRRITFLSEDADSRANVGCVNGSSAPVRINLGVFNSQGAHLATRTMDLAPYSNNQLNRVFRDYEPVNGYVDVWTDSEDALYYCYGSMLDNLTSDPTTILPQVPSADMTFIPAAALAAGLEGSFFQTDVDLNNAGSTNLTYRLVWLPRGADNSEPVRSDLFALAPGAGVRYANVLGSVFGLEPDQVGGLAVEATGIDLLAMSRTYNLPSGKVAGTFGQELPGIPSDRMIPAGLKKRIIFMNENDDVRSNVGCQNAGGSPVTVKVQLTDSEGTLLETRTMNLPPYSNNQITRLFRNFAPISAGYVDVWTDIQGASIFCYGSVLDNSTSDPTTVLPQ
ncbi:MAG: hypothetical protein C3F15_14360 [Holophagae bacterium]|nr:MAG: hypothetical protein C3F15_14360 [Holophagae bacterium]